MEKQPSFFGGLEGGLQVVTGVQGFPICSAMSRSMPALALRCHKTKTDSEAFIGEQGEDRELPQEPVP